MVRTAQKETEIFENMPIRRAVLTLAVPTVISQLIVMVYNLADTWFIGQTGDPYPLPDLKQEIDTMCRSPVSFFHVRKSLMSQGF